MQAHIQRTTDSRSSRVLSNQQYEAHLAFNLSIYDEETEGETGVQPVTLTGYTQSISDDTLTLVGPFYHFGYRYLMGHDRTLQIVVRLPNAVINIQGFPVRYTKISDDKLADGYMLTGPNITSFGETDVNCLIEVSIVVMSDSDRAQYTQYLSQFHHNTEVEFKVLPPKMERPPQKTAPLYVAASETSSHSGMQKSAVNQ